MNKEEIDKIRKDINARPLKDFDNLSSADMHNLIYCPFTERSILKFKEEINNETLDQIGFQNLIEFLIQQLTSNREIKLTKWNNLNTKLTTEIYRRKFTNEVVIELRERKIYKQDDLLSLQNAMIILNRLTKITKTRKNKLSLTKKGIKISKPEKRIELFKTIFMSYGLEFNWSFHDGYSDSNQIQSTLGYILYMLLKYGNIERSTNFYAEKLNQAFPHLITEFESSWSTPQQRLNACLSIRCFERFLEWFDLITVRKIRGELGINHTYIKNKLLDKVLRIDEDKYKFSKSKFYA